MPGRADDRGRVLARQARVPIVAALLDLVSSLAPSLVATAATWDLGRAAHGTPVANFLFCVLVSLLFVGNNVLREEYDPTNFLTFAGHAGRVVLSWNTAFLTIMLIATATGQTFAPRPHIGLLLCYGVGLMGALAGRALCVAKVKRQAVNGSVAAVRVLLVGDEAEIEAFSHRFTPWIYGVDIIGSFVLRERADLRDDLALARAAARMLKPDDVYILVPWTDVATIETCVDAFVKVPASIHLGPPPILDRYSAASVSRVGRIHSVNLVRRPLTRTEQALKRAIDLAIALPSLVLLTPLFIGVALAIKLEDGGPIFFLQRRYGFNQETFRIVKFRSMRVAEDGSQVRQATRQDSRVTSVGRILRRCNIDELPQLLNVLRGEMSLVGPRPHALSHNQRYEQSIADYARRHNVKPGITGWAQIHGLRGEVPSTDFMERRLQHDLYYIDNWSMGLDLRILAMTVLSTKAFTNAY